jgi:CheY-like chemotaxis protein
MSAVALREGERATALVVDGNATSRRFVELALERSGSFLVESANDAQAALEILGTQVIDLIVSDTDLADENGLAFYRRLAQASRLRSIPFLFLSADRSVETKAAALRAGVEDYLMKPCDVVELVARAEAAVLRQRRFREALRARTYTLAGDFSAMAFPDLVTMVEMGRRSGVLSVVTTSRVGRVYFECGRVVHATYGNLEGEVAFQRIFGEPEGQFEFTHGACPVGRDAFTIHESVTGLLMEAARVVDTERSFESGERPSSPRHLTTMPPAGAPLEPPLAGDTMLAAQLELALRDPFVLGELRVWKVGDLQRWTQREVGRDRLHVLLVADLGAGVSSMLALGGAPTERWVIDSLAPEKKAFGLTFMLRHERMIDVVLVDARAPIDLLPSLRRTPSIVLVCPPEGDLLALGTAARVGLDELLSTLSPSAVVGLGNAGLDSRLGAMGSLQGRIFRSATGMLGEGTDDLRDLLIKGVRLWSSTASAMVATVRPPAREAT